jgi:hypothetical protein
MRSYCPDDSLTWQERLVHCRALKIQLVRSSSNVKDVGLQIGVAMKFLESIDEKLDVIDSKLDALQAHVSAIGADLRHLIGRPVLEVFDERRGARAAMPLRRCGVSDGAMVAHVMPI